MSARKAADRCDGALKREATRIISEEARENVERSTRRRAQFK